MTDETRPSPAAVSGSPEEAFAALGDQTRVEIILELARVANKQEPGSGLTFSELREQVGVSDSGRFNYHLNQLVPTFVRRDEDRYYAGYAALAMTSAVHAGLYDHDGGTETADAGWDCWQCGSPVSIVYESEESTLMLDCPEHGVLVGYPAPPGARSGRSLEELMDVVFLRALSEMSLCRKGVCQRCWGTVSVTQPADSPSAVEAPDNYRMVSVRCDTCWLAYQVPLRILVASDPQVLAFYREHGYSTAEVLTGPQPVGAPGVCEVTERPSAEGEQQQFEVTVTLDEETLTLTVTGRGMTQEISRGSHPERPPGPVDR